MRVAGKEAAREAQNRGRAIKAAGREETILADPLPQLECGPSWGFVSRRFESFGQ